MHLTTLAFSINEEVRRYFVRVMSWYSTASQPILMHKLTISVSENNGRYDVEIRNNGRAVNPPIQEGGGLSSLRKRLEQDGATMSYRYNGAVTLILTIPKE